MSHFLSPDGLFKRTQSKLDKLPTKILVQIFRLAWDHRPWEERAEMHVWALEDATERCNTLVSVGINVSQGWFNDKHITLNRPFGVSLAFLQYSPTHGLTILKPILLRSFEQWAEHKTPRIHRKTLKSGPYKFLVMDPKSHVNVVALSTYSGEADLDANDVPWDLARRLSRVPETECTLLQSDDYVSLPDDVVGESDVSDDEEEGAGRAKPQKVPTTLKLAALCSKRRDQRLTEKEEMATRRKNHVDESRRFRADNKGRHLLSGRQGHRIGRPADNKIKQLLPHTSEFWKHDLHFENVNHVSAFFEADLTRIYQIQRFWFFLHRSEVPSENNSISKALRYVCWADKRREVYFTAKFRVPNISPESFSTVVCRLNSFRKSENARIYNGIPELLAYKVDYEPSIYFCPIPLEEISIEEANQYTLYSAGGEAASRKHFGPLFNKAAQCLRNITKEFDFNSNRDSTHPGQIEKPVAIEWNAEAQSVLDRHLTRMEIIYRHWRTIFQAVPLKHHIVRHTIDERCPTI